MAELTPQLFVEPTAQAAAQRAAELVTGALSGGEPRTLTLAGGSTPEPLYRLLAERDLPWPQVTIAFGDERVAPPDDPALNASMAQRALLDHVHPHAVHRIEVERGAAAAAAHYGALVDTLTLDLVLLGMGGDGHTASLFPGGPEDGGTAVVTESPAPPPIRVSLSRPTLARADTILVIVTGAGKASRLAAVWPQLLGPVDHAAAPVARVRPRRRWWWVLDAAAAAELPDDVRGSTHPSQSGDEA